MQDEQGLLPLRLLPLRPALPPFSDTYEVTASGEMLLTRSASALGDFEDQRETGGVAGLHRGVAGG